MQLPQGAWDALVSFVFNLGEQAFVNANGSMTVFCRVLNAGQFDAIPAQMKRWVYDNGQKVKGLVLRRDREAAEWAAAFKEVAHG
jgi:lysozyme